MIKISGAGCKAAALVAAVVVGLSSAAQAKEPTKAELDAAHSAVEALHATDDFDGILPSAAAALKHSLIQAEPNLQEEITQTVDEQALKLAARRGDLEKEVATIYAKAFTVDQLNAIAKFYHSDAGKKLLAEGSNVTRQSLQAAHIWSNGIARDLANAVHTALEAKLGKDAPAKAPGTPTVTPGATPVAPAAQ